MHSSSGVGHGHAAKAPGMALGATKTTVVVAILGNSPMGVKAPIVAHGYCPGPADAPGPKAKEVHPCCVLFVVITQVGNPVPAF